MALTYGHRALSFKAVRSCVQVAPQLQVIVCREEPLIIPRLSTAEARLAPLPGDAVFQLLAAGAPKVSRPRPWCQTNCQPSSDSDSNTIF